MPGKSLFPPVSIGEARQIADTVAQTNAGQPTRRLDVFNVLGKAPDSGPSRNLVTSSSGFALTTGSYRAETISLTDLGRRLAIDRDASAAVDAVLGVDIFGKFFDTYKDKSIPADVAGKSFLADSGIPTARVQACWDLVLENGRQVGLIREMSGAERVLPREHAVELLGGQPQAEAAAGRREVQEEHREDQHRRKPTLPSVNINLEIHLPGDATPEQYEAIFSSMRKHLIDDE